KPLTEWLVDELNLRNDVPKGLAQRWVEAEQILPLLDGLDETAMEHREACVEAINNFRRDHGLADRHLSTRSEITTDPTKPGHLQLADLRLTEPLSKTSGSPFCTRNCSRPAPRPDDRTEQTRY